MGIRSGAFEDTEYYAEDFNLAFKSCLSNGVRGTISTTELQVVANTNMGIAVLAGVAWIEGTYLINDSYNFV